MGFEENVFINCPLDKTYIDNLLKPILYIIIKNGFNPRLALENSDSGQIRLEKITTIITECKYSIHDLSIVKSRRANEYARMNMPFELGIDYGIRRGGVKHLSTKKFLILEAKKYDYMKAASDLNGFDIKVHGNKTQKIFDCLHSWCSETLKVRKQDPPKKIYYEFIDFNKSLFEEKIGEFNSVRLAKNYIEKISIIEYIEEIHERL